MIVVGLEGLNVHARTATNVEEVGMIVFFHYAKDPVENNFTPGDIPPVSLFDILNLSVDFFFHSYS